MDENRWLRHLLTKCKNQLRTDTCKMETGEVFCVRRATDSELSISLPSQSVNPIIIMVI